MSNKAGPGRKAAADRWAAQWRRWLPGLVVWRSYQWSWLWPDTLSGLVLAAVTIPVVVAYAVAAGLDGVYGLYATIAAFFAYAVFGPNRHMVVAPGSALISIILVVVMNASVDDPAYAIMLASMMALVSGIVCLAAGLARLGFVTELLSRPIRSGFINGIALTVIASQIPGLFGLKVKGDNALIQMVEFFPELFSGAANLKEAAVGIGVLLFMLLWRKRFLPVEFVAVVLAAIVGAVFQLGHHGVTVLGVLPAGMPEFTFPAIKVADWGAVLVGGFAAAVYSLSTGSVLARSFSTERQSRDIANQEMVALGLSNFTAGLFQGFPVAASPSRTPIIMASGAKTQLTAVVAALVIIALISFAPGLLKTLPESALAAVVIMASVGIVEIRPLLWMFQVQRAEFWLSMSCFVGVIILGAVPGIALAIFIAMAQFLWRAWRPHYAVLGRVKGVKGYHDITRYPDAFQRPGLVLFRWDAPLFFANAEWFYDSVIRVIENAPTRTQWLVVAADPITGVDVTAGDMLLELDAELHKRHVRLRFAAMKDPVKDQLKRLGLFEHFGEEAFYPTVGQAVSQYRRAQSRRRAAKEAGEEAAED